MEYGHPVAPSNGQQQTVRPHAPVSGEQPRAEADLRSAVGDEEEHHEKKPMMTKMKDRMRKIKNTVTHKKHGHADDHDVQDDDEHSVAASEGKDEGHDEGAEEEMETEMEPEIHHAPQYEYESTATLDDLGGAGKSFTTDRRDEHIDIGIEDSLGGIDDLLPLSSRGEDVPLSSRDDCPVTLASRDQLVPPGREEHASLGGLQEPPITPETIDADLVDPLPNGSVSRTDDGYESITTPDDLGGRGNSFTIDRGEEHIDNGIEDSLGGRDELLPLSSRGEHVPLSSRDDRPITLASGDQLVPPGGLGSQSERLVSLGDREENASLGGLQEPPVTPETTDADPVDPLPNGSVSRTDDGNISYPETGNEQSMSPDVLSSFRDMDISSDVEKKPSYTEKLSSTAVSAKNAAVSAASTVYAKVAGGTHSGETHDQIGTPLSSGAEVEPKEGAGEKKGSYAEKLSSTAVAAKDAAVSAASTVYAKAAGGTHSGEKHDECATPATIGPGVEVEPREGAGEKKGTYTEKLTGTALAAKDAAMNAASTVYGKVTGKVQPGGGTEQEKGVSVREYLAEKLRPGEDDKALCEVISESMKKKGVDEHEAMEDKEGEVKGRIVLPEVTAGEIGVKRDVGKVGGGDGGEGMMEKINGAVSSMVGRGGGSGGPAAAAERAHE